jgi:hypothetical protein
MAAPAVDDITLVYQCPVTYLRRASVFDADFDVDGVPDLVEDLGGDGSLGPGETDPLNPDTDGDGQSDGDEAVAGMNGTDADSIFAISRLTPLSVSNVLIQWYSASNRTYSVDSCSDLVAETWGNLTSDIPATPPLNTETVKTANAWFWSRFFYRIRAKDR